MKRYPTYKNSDIEWIGEIPEHWEVVKLKYLVKEALKYGANESATESNPDHPRYIRITDFGSNGKLRDETFKSLPPEKAEEYLLDDGDVLFARSGATVGKTFLFKGYTGQACFAGYLIKASHNENIIPEYLYYFTKSGGYGNWKNSVFDQATIQNISAEKYNNLHISIGSTEEQTQIANYLDHQTGIIDQLIEKKKQLIEKLKGQRQSIINEAVTKGLDPNAKLKDSGIEWIGEIPEHWEVVKLKYLVSYNDETLSEKTEDDRTIDYIEIGDVEFPNGIIRSTKMLFKDAPSRARRIVRTDDVIVSTVRTYLKAIATIDEERDGSIASTGFCVLRPIDILPGYLSYTSESEGFIGKVISESKGVSYPAINSSELLEIEINVPSKEEQSQIANYLDHQTGIIDQILEKTELSIEKLEEQRRSIISEAVTGKVDVRDWEK